MNDGGPDHRLPPRREQLPLPRRDGQTHLEPQLREPGGTGSGTPFAAFDTAAAVDGVPAGGGPEVDGRAADTVEAGGDHAVSEHADDEPAADDPGAGPFGSRAAAFRAAVRRATGRPSRRTG